jgi:hypothetical protein
VPAYRLTRVEPDAAGHARHLDRVLLGRDAELGALRAAFEAAVSERAARLVTVLGIAGVGKSRLVAELLSSVADQAQVLKGRCLPYGEGITYWPIRELVHAAADITEGDSADEARAKVVDLLEGAPDAELVAGRVNAAVGLETERAPQEEIFWAIRKLLEHLARQRPVVAVIEDIHWAEPTLLDLLEFVVDLATDAPLLMVCPARPELLEKRPGWGGNRASSTALRLEPLAEAVTAELIDALPGGAALPGRLRARIFAAAEGNPLYLEEMLAMLIDEGHIVERDGAWQASVELDDLPIPLSVQALLAARIDALPESERRVAERASVAGRVFDAAAVRELVDDAREEVGPSLLALVRKELLRPERSELSAGDAFKFRHLLIRDAAYEALSKAERAELHERFADWLAKIGGERVGEYEEILGYHLDQGHRYRAELGESGERVAALAERAATHYLAAAAIAERRDDFTATGDLAHRAARLLPEGDAKADALEQEGDAHLSAGRDADAGRAIAALHDIAQRTGDPVLNARAFALSTRIASKTDPHVNLRASEEGLNQAAPMLIHEPRARARVLLVLADIQVTRGAYQLAIASARAAAESARTAGDGRTYDLANLWIVHSLLLGTTPFPKAVRDVNLIIPEITSRAIRGEALYELGVVLTASGLHGDAREALTNGAGLLGESRAGLQATIFDARVAILRSEHKLAAQLLRGLLTRLDPSDTAFRSSVLASLAESLLAQGLIQGAREAADEAERLAHRDDADARVISLAVSAEIFAQLSEPERAETFARAALSIADETESLEYKGRAALALAIALRASGRTDEALKAGKSALRHYQRKGHVVGAQRAAQVVEAIIRSANVPDTAPPSTKEGRRARISPRLTAPSRRPR